MDLKQLKPIVNDPNVWKVLDKYFEECYNMKHRQIDGYTDIHDILRAQGFSQAFLQLRSLRNTINHAQ